MVNGVPGGPVSVKLTCCVAGDPGPTVSLIDEGAALMGEFNANGTVRLNGSCDCPEMLMVMAAPPVPWARKLAGEIKTVTTATPLESKHHWPEMDGGQLVALIPANQFCGSRVPLGLVIGETMAFN